MPPKSTTGAPAGGDAPATDKDKKGKDKDKGKEPKGKESKGKPPPPEPEEPEEPEKTASQIALEEAEYRAMMRKQRFKRRWPDVTKVKIHTKPWQPPGPPQRMPPVVIELPSLPTRPWKPPYTRRRRPRPKLQRIPPEELTKPLYDAHKLRRIWHNFIQVEKNKMMCQGSIGCNSKRYSSTHCGSQTGCIAVVCKALLEEKDTSEFIQRDVDDCISTGDNYYKRCLVALKCYKGSHRKAWTSERIFEVINDIKKARVATSSGHKKTPMDYYWMSKYDIVTTDNEDCLIFKKLTANAPTVRILPRENYFDILSEVHEAFGHGGRDKILAEIKNKYYIPKKAVEIFVSLCPTCEIKRSTPRKSIVTKPSVSREFNLRGQFNLIDFQSSPDGEFKWVLNYQDSATKFLNLRPLKTKTAIDVASELIKIFLIFGAPYILESDEGREFTLNVIKELVGIWPECKIVHGNSETVEKHSRDIENSLQKWMKENKSTNWSFGCHFVQYSKNSLFHPSIGRSPYKGLFGREPKAGLSGSDIPISILKSIETEEQLKAYTQNESSEIIINDYENNDNHLETYPDEITESVSLKETAISPFNSHRCNCKPAINQCRNNRCACFKHKVLCGYKCHISLACVNK